MSVEGQTKKQVVCVYLYCDSWPIFGGFVV